MSGKMAASLTRAMAVAGGRATWLVMRSVADFIMTRQMNDRRDGDASGVAELCLLLCELFSVREAGVVCARRQQRAAAAWCARHEAGL